MGDVTEWVKLTWPEAKEVVERMPVCVLPVGAIEAHGPHLPLETDNLLATEICRRVCRETGVVLLPTLPYGQVWSLYDFPGTLSVSIYTLIAVIKDIIASLRDRGFKIIFVQCGHLGNLPAIKQAIRECYSELPGAKYVLLHHGGLKNAENVLTAKRSHHTYIHACEIETSQMLECAPGAVRMERAVCDYPDYPLDFDVTPTPWSAVTTTGVLGDATAATAAKGKALVDAMVSSMVALVRYEMESIQ
ncbi:MAG: creatininase family protein [bacterium]|jgi:creatinine amidohydrolase